MYHVIFPNVEFGKTYYTRRDDMVKAVKVLRIECRPGNYSFIKCNIAGEGVKQLTHITLYETIEDCIKGVNVLKEIDVVYRISRLKSEVEIEKIYGFQHVVRYVWDGFKPKKVYFNLNNFLIYGDVNHTWTIETLNGEVYKTYETYDECLADNYIKVVEF